MSAWLSKSSSTRTWSNRVLIYNSVGLLRAHQKRVERLSPLASLPGPMTHVITSKKEPFFLLRQVLASESFLADFQVATGNLLTLVYEIKFIGYCWSRRMDICVNFWWIHSVCVCIHTIYMYIHIYTYYICIIHKQAFQVAQWERICLLSRRFKFDPCPGKIPWRRKWQSTAAFLPGKSHGQRSLVGYRPWGCKRVEHNLVTKEQQQYLPRHIIYPHI